MDGKSWIPWSLGILGVSVIISLLLVWGISYSITDSHGYHQNCHAQTEQIPGSSITITCPQQVTR